MCYWPGEGKERQFPPSFGKRGSLKGTAFSTRQGGFKPETKAHIMTTDTPDEGNEQVFAYMSIDQKDFKVLATLIFSANCHKLHSAISPSILHRFSRSQWLRKALKKTFR